MLKTHTGDGVSFFFAAAAPFILREPPLAGAAHHAVATRRHFPAIRRKPVSPPRVPAYRYAHPIHGGKHETRSGTALAATTGVGPGAHFRRHRLPARPLRHARP